MPNRISLGRRRTSKSTRAGLQFPVTRIGNNLKKQPIKVKRVSQGAGVYLAGVIEYLTAEILELSGNAAKDMRKKRITPRHIKLAIGHDNELEELLRNIIIPEGGVIPTLKNNIKPSTPIRLPIKKVKIVTSSNPLFNANPFPNFSFPNVPPKTKKGVTTLGQRTLNKGQTLTVSQGDITDVKADVYASHYYLSGMVGSAISNKGGQELRTIINKHKKKTLTNCEVDISDAGKNLLCQKLIHVHSPSWDTSKQTLKINELSRCVENILLIAESNKLKSIALPSISSGGNGYPKQVAAQTILRAINKHFKILEKNEKATSSSIKEVFFVLYDTESVNVYTSELGKLDIQ